MKDKNHNCGLIETPLLYDCSEGDYIVPYNTITGLKIYANGKVTDQNDNYIGEVKTTEAGHITQGDGFTIEIKLP